MKRVYKANDGTEFQVKRAAEAHNDLLELAGKYREIVQEIAGHIGKTAHTADGRLLDDVLTQWRLFYVYEAGPWSLATVRTIFVHLWSSEVSVEDGTIVLRHYDPDCGRYDTYRVNQIYACESAAEKAALVKSKEAVAEMQAEVEKMAATESEE